MGYQTGQQPFVNVKNFGAKGDGVTDDAAAVQRAITALAGLGLALYFPTGTYIFDSTVTVPNSPLRIVGTGQDKTILKANMVIATNPLQSIFLAGPVNGNATTLNGAAVVGSNQVTLATNAGGQAIVGATIQIARSGLRALLFQITHLAGLVATLDRPILDAYPNGAGVTVITSRPTGIEIEDLTMTGTSTRYVEIIAGLDCHIRRVRCNITGGASSDLMMSYDIGGLRCSFESCVVDYGSAPVIPGNSPVCLAVESGESCWLEDCQLYNSLNSGVALYDCFDTSLVDVEAEECLIGFQITADGSVLGCDNTQLTNCRAYSSTTNDYFISNGTTNTTLTNCQGRYCASISVNIDGNCSGIRLVGGRFSNATTANVEMGDGAKALKIVGVDLSACAGTCLVLVGAGDASLSDCQIDGACGTAFSIPAAGTLDIDGLVCRATFTANFCSVGGTIRVRGLDLNTATAAINVFLITAGTTKIEQSKLQAGAASNVINNAGTLFFDSTTIVVGGGGNGVVATGGEARWGSNNDLTGCTTPLLWNGGIVTGRGIQYNGVAAAAGGTFVVTLALPNSISLSLRARISMLKSAGPYAGSAGLLAEAGVDQTGGVAGFAGAIAGSTNPQNSNTAGISAANPEWSAAAFVSGGGAPPTAVWTVAGATAVLTVTNPSPANGANVKVLLDIDQAA